MALVARAAQCHAAVGSAAAGGLVVRSLSSEHSTASVAAPRCRHVSVSGLREGMVGPCGKASHNLGLSDDSDTTTSKTAIVRPSSRRRDGLNGSICAVMVGTKATDSGARVIRIRTRGRRSKFFLGTPIQSREMRRSQIAKSPYSQEGRRGSAPAAPARAEGFDLWKLFGGRALTGEENLKSDEGMDKLFKDAARSLAGTKKEQLEAPDLAGFDKELGGLTGGWPGGERGVEDFVINYPAPRKISKELQLVKEELAEIVVATKPSVVPLPLLMPGMTVIVNNPEDPFYMYSGIVQRITDGKVGVLFEGGNWDKLITFPLENLKRTAAGPPGKNPKSAILEINLSD